ncbi:hypothetical protein FACS1894190_07140 [Spirochaetia bacterium]|nr:hypothetical protein FACS1894190_07140 [Spirochaetia bacterium]
MNGNELQQINAVLDREYPGITDKDILRETASRRRKKAERKYFIKRISKKYVSKIPVVFAGIMIIIVALTGIGNLYIKLLLCITILINLKFIKGRGTKR